MLNGHHITTDTLIVVCHTAYLPSCPSVLLKGYSDHLGTEMVTSRQHSLERWQQDCLISVTLSLVFVTKTDRASGLSVSLSCAGVWDERGQYRRTGAKKTLLTQRL